MPTVVATGKVNGNNDIGRSRSFLRFAETIGVGYCSATQRLLACEDGMVNITMKSSLHIKQRNYINIVHI